MNNEKYTQTNSTNEPVHCKDCQHLMFSDCYGECTKCHLGIVRPDDSCEFGERRATIHV